MKENARTLEVANIRAISEAELKTEQFRNAVDSMKEKLRKEKWHHKIFPWKIVFVRRT